MSVLRSLGLVVGSFGLASAASAVTWADLSGLTCEGRGFGGSSDFVLVSCSAPTVCGVSWSFGDNTVYETLNVRHDTVSGTYVESTDVEVSTGVSGTSACDAASCTLQLRFDPPSTATRTETYALAGSQLTVTEASSPGSSATHVLTCR